MRIEAALVGNLEAEMKAELQRGERAVTLGTRSTIDHLKATLRAQTLTAFGSQRLANAAWRSEVYPKGQASLGAAGVLYSKAPHIVEAFSQTTTIRSKSGFFLAIPSPEAMKMRGPRGQRPTPDSLEQRLGLKLQFVYRPGKASLLVANLRERRGKRGGFAAPSAAATKRGDVQSVVLFFLVPMVRLKQVFDLDRAYERAGDDLVNKIVEEWNRGG